MINWMVTKKGTDSCEKKQEAIVATDLPERTLGDDERFQTAIAELDETYLAFEVVCREAWKKEN